jgi:hypothetical protein
MSIITKAGTPVKGTPTEFTLNKSNLAQVASILNDPYFSIQDNWKNVIIYYKSSIGNQKQVLDFDATTASPSSDFLVSIRARDIFQVQKIIVQDFDGGSIVVPRSELNESEFDVDMGAILPFYTVESGVNDSYNTINSLKVNNFFNPSTGGYTSNSALLFYNPNPVGMTNNETYKFRFYLSSLTTVGTNFSMRIQGYGTPVVKTGTQVLQEFNANGYIEFNYLAAAGYGFGISIESPNQGESSFTVSKIEIYPV